MGSGDTVGLGDLESMECVSALVYAGEDYQEEDERLMRPRCLGREFEVGKRMPIVAQPSSLPKSHKDHVYMMMNQEFFFQKNVGSTISGLSTN